jgi:hypothetical protein
MYDRFMRVVALSAFVILCMGATETQAAKLNTAEFVAACTEDQIVAEDPAFEDGKVTPKTYCECVAGKFEGGKLSQDDVNMLTKMHNEDITDADAESHPNLEDLMVVNEGYEDACKESLGLSTGEDTDEAPDGEDMVPEDGMPDEGAPGEEQAPPD